MQLITVGKDNWRLDGSDAAVAEVRLSFRLSVLVQDAEQPTALIIIGPSQVWDRAGPWRSEVDPAKNDERLGRLLVAIRGQALVECTVSEQAVLSVHLGSGLRLVCAPQGGYEAWELQVGNAMIVCMPGGELAVWSGTS